MISSDCASVLGMRPPLSYNKIKNLLGIHPRKKFGQNFLLDEPICRKMIELSNVRNCHVVEVGSGPGTLTRNIIIEGCSELDCVEIDRRFIPFLNKLIEGTQTPVRIHNEDIFKFDFINTFRNIQNVDWDDYALPNARIIGNLPFNISIGLILQWMRALSEKKGPFRFGRIPMYLTFQEEVAKNILTKENVEFSRLTIMVQNYCRTKRICFLHGSVFKPEPKINAIFIEIIPRVKPLIDIPFNILEQLVKGAFQYRQKYFFDGNIERANRLMSIADVEPNKHCYMLSFKDWESICQAYLKLIQEEELPFITHPIKSPPEMVDYNPD